MNNLVLYTKPDCHLCDEMKQIIFDLHKDFSFNFLEVDISCDNVLLEKYKEKIPVLEINGRIFSKFKVDEKKLRAKFSNK